MARAVEFAEIDGLPGAEEELPFIDEDGLRDADERRLDVGVGVPLPVVIVAFEGDEPGEGALDVALDRGIRPLVDRHPGGGVGDVDVTDPAGDAPLFNHFLYLVGDIDELVPRPALDVDVPDHLSLPEYRSVEAVVDGELNTERDQVLREF